MTDERKVEQRLPSLKLDLDGTRWTPEHEIEGAVRVLDRHVERRPVLRLP